MHQRRWALVVLAAAAGAASAAHAQVTAEGMLRGQQARKVDLHASADIEYDSNIARSTEAQARARGLTLDDTIYTPTVSADVFQPVGHQAVFLKGDVGYIFHQNNKKLDSDRISLAGGFGNKLGPCGSTVIGGYERGRNELDSTTLSQLVENILTVKRADVAITCARPSGLGMVLTGSRIAGSNSQVLVQTGDYDTTSGSAGVFLGSAQAGTITLTGSYSKTNYVNRVPTPGDGRGFESVSGGILLDRHLGGRIEANVGVNYTHVHTLDFIPAPVANGPVSDFNGLTYSGGLTFRASSRLNAQATFEREVLPTIVQGGSYEIQTNFSVSGSYRIGTRITALLGVRQQEVRVQGGQPVVNPIPSLLAIDNSTTKAVFGSLRYQQSRRISLVLNAQREERRTDNPQFDYDSNRVGVALALSY